MNKESQPPAEILELIQAINSPAPRFYASSTSIAVNNSDLVVLLKSNSQCIGLLNLSYTSAKTLATNLLDAIANMEKIMGQPILTSEVIAERMKQHGQQVK